MKFLFFRPWTIEKRNKNPLSQFCFNPLIFVSFLNFVSLFSSRENETKMSWDSIWIFFFQVNLMVLSYDYFAVLQFNHFQIFEI